jgi:histone H3/H4
MEPGSGKRLCVLQLLDNQLDDDEELFLTAHPSSTESTISTVDQTIERPGHPDELVHTDWDAEEQLDRCLERCADQVAMPGDDGLLAEQLLSDMALHETLDARMQDYLSSMREAITLSPSGAITNRLPLARIKRIMKQDANNSARMIGADAVPAVALACQLFMGALTKRAWELARRAGRNTLQHKDLISAIVTSERFDFLIDVVDEFQSNQQADPD